MPRRPHSSQPSPSHRASAAPPGPAPLRHPDWPDADPRHRRDETLFAALAILAGVAALAFLIDALL